MTPTRLSPWARARSPGPNGWPDYLPDYKHAVDHLASLLVRNERGTPAKAHTTLVNGVWSPGSNSVRSRVSKD